MNKLFEYQKSGIEFLKEKKKAILADSMGMGKTIQAIIACKELGGKTLVVCPASVKENWRREIKMAYETAQVEIIEKENSIGDIGWCIINYDILEKKKEFLDSLEFDNIILDEAHYIKNQKSKRSKQAVALCKKAKNVFLLTGTPILNRPIELFNLLRAIEHPLGNNYFWYARNYCAAWWMELKNGRRFLNVSGASNLDILKEKIANIYLRRTKEEKLNLPAKIITNVELEMDENWRKKYETVFTNYLEFLKENPLIDVNINNVLMARHLVELQKMKQVCSWSKVDRIVEDVENIAEQGEKVIIFSQYTKTIKDLKEKLRKLGVVSLTGEDNMAQRQEAIDHFQNDNKIKIFIGNTKAAGIGINLTASSYVIFADLEWTPALHSQAEDRAHRIGQDKMVNVYYYILKGTIEEDIVELLEKKNGIIQKILSGTAGRYKDINVAGGVINKISKYHE